MSRDPKPIGGGGGAKLNYIQILRLNDMQDVPKPGGWGKSIEIKAKILPL